MSVQWTPLRKKPVTKTELMEPWLGELTTHLDQVPKLRMSGAILQQPLHAFVVWDNFSFTFSTKFMDS
jgi:hypothetical protein